jgi:hypothetical protein
MKAPAFLRLAGQRIMSLLLSPFAIYANQLNTTILPSMAPFMLIFSPKAAITHASRDVLIERSR